MVTEETSTKGTNPLHYIFVGNLVKLDIFLILLYKRTSCFSYGVQIEDLKNIHNKLLKIIASVNSKI